MECLIGHGLDTGRLSGSFVELHTEANKNVIRRGLESGSKNVRIDPELGLDRKDDGNYSRINGGSRVQGIFCRCPNGIS